MPGIVDGIITAVVDADLTQTPIPGSLHATHATRVRPVDVVDVGMPMPVSGEEFGGFTLIDELGRGAFGRVYLASEHKLANRLVALKVTRKHNRESQKLARLQHTNIVPIHNAFEVNAWHVLQMPYFGRQTLAHLIDAIRAEKTFPNVNPGVFASTQMRASTSRKPATAGSQGSAAPESDHLRIPPETSDAEPQPSRDLLVGLPYTDAAIWLVARMADGLAHAHAKGILHLDLKPHNVLLSDDGQPMLLDFNLAFDLNTQDRDRVGGTWPYMSPEQIGEYTKLQGSYVDGRSDLYSLGVMFFELLTLKHPFPPVRSTDDGLKSAIAVRKAGAPDVRTHNPNVPPSIAAVVAKLLEADPAQRYQSADELREDLRRHSDHRPLLGVANYSIKERMIKWHRRNPKLSLVVCGGVLALGLAFTAVQMMAWSHDRESTAAKIKADTFRKDFVGMRADLASVVDADRRGKALETAKAWLDDYSVGVTPGWIALPALRLLPAEEKENLRLALAETALLAAHAEWLTGRHDANATHLKAAQNYNAVARVAFGSNPPAMVASQARELAGEKPDLRTEASDDPADLYSQAVRLIADGACSEASTRLVKLTQLAPDHFAGQYALGYCYETLGQSERATEHFQVAKPLGPQDARPAFHRGLLLQHAGKLDEAEADLSEAILRERFLPGARLQRASVRKAKGDLAGARRDLTAEIDNERGHRFIALAMRAQVNEKLGDTAAAATDLKTLETLTPVTDLDYVARAARWINSDPKKALADYDRALKLNGDCYSALLNKAHIYGDLLRENEKAINSMKLAVERFPNLNKVRAGHAVLLARLGKRSEAHAEAEMALLLGSDPLVTYQAANVFAITSKIYPEDAERSLVLFRQCLREGFRDYAMIATDPDMDAVREKPEFVKVLAAAKELGK